MKTYLNIPYGGEEGQLFDLYLPDDTGSVKHVAVWFFGGGIENGKKEDNAFLAESLTEKGIALCLPNYRLMPKVAYPAFIEDAALSVRGLSDFLKTLSINADITIGGSSAGAYLSLMLCFDRHYFENVGLSSDDIHAYFFNSGQPTAHFNVLKNRGIDARRVIIDETSALFYVDEGLPHRPMLILTAENDIPSRVTQNILLKETLLRFGLEENLIRMEILKGYGHCGYDREKNKTGEYILVDYLVKLINSFDE